MNPTVGADAKAQLGVNLMVPVGPLRWRGLLGQFWTPVARMLEAVIVLQLTIGQSPEALLVAALLVFNAVAGWRPRWLTPATARLWCTRKFA